MATAGGLAVLLAATATGLHAGPGISPSDGGPNRTSIPPEVRSLFPMTANKLDEVLSADGEVKKSRSGQTHMLGKVCVLTVFVGSPYERLFNTTGVFWSKYSKKHGHVFVPIHLGGSIPYAGVMDIMWLAVLRAFQKGCGWAALVDVDSAIVNYDAPLTRLFDEEGGELVIAHQNRDEAPNLPPLAKGGLRILKNSDIAVDYVRQLLTTMAASTCPDGSGKSSDGFEQPSMQCIVPMYKDHIQWMAMAACNPRNHPGGAVMFGKHTLGKEGEPSFDHDSATVVQMWGCKRREKLDYLKRIHGCTKWNTTDPYICDDCGL